MTTWCFSFVVASFITLTSCLICLQHILVGCHMVSGSNSSWKVFCLMWTMAISHSVLALYSFPSEAFEVLAGYVSTVDRLVTVFDCCVSLSDLCYCFFIYSSLLMSFRFYTCSGCFFFDLPSASSLCFFRLLSTSPTLPRILVSPSCPASSSLPPALPRIPHRISVSAPSSSLPRILVSPLFFPVSPPLPPCPASPYLFLPVPLASLSLLPVLLPASLSFYCPIPRPPTIQPINTK
jgi:hypothetical protein